MPLRLNPINQRRLANFKANRRGYVSLHVFLVLFGLSLFAEFIANDKPFLIRYDGGIYLPFLKAYPETTFGGDFPTEADYTDPFVAELIQERGWMLWPPIPYSYDTVVLDLPGPAPVAAYLAQPAGHRRPGARRARPGDLRLSHLGAVRPGADHPELGGRGDRRAPSRATTAAGSTCCSSASSRSGPRCRRSFC